VGRFFHDHPQVAVGAVRAADPASVERYLGPQQSQGIEVLPRLSLTAEQQRAHRVLNAQAYVFGPLYPRSLLRRAMAVNLLRQMGREQHAARDLIDAAKTLVGPTLSLHWERRLHAAEARGYFQVSVVTEQEPCPTSRITLSGRRDRYGMPRAKITWHKTQKTWDTVAHLARTLRDEVRKARLGELEVWPHISPTKSYWRVFMHDTYHHMGGTRMGSSPVTGVVDENCKVHGVDNLYIASSSVFPTGGHSNVTLTIMALSFRLAEHLITTPIRIE
jgi:choline dehydrogenase-like flavoprotein